MVSKVPKLGPRWLRKHRGERSAGAQLKADYARDIRSFPTRSEEAFWAMAKGAGLGTKCRRQHTLAPPWSYVIDFYFARERVAVEFEGPGARDRTDWTKQHDEIRDRTFRRLGIYRLVLAPSLVLKRPDKVRSAIVALLTYRIETG